MDADHLTALRQAASALISTAAAPTVLAALRTLLADPEFAVEAPALPLQPKQPASAPGLPAPRPARDKPTAAAKPAAALNDPAWDTLRHAVRQAMTAQGVDFADLGQIIGRSATAVRIDLTSRKPPRPPIQAKFTAWLQQDAPEVAPSGATFRGNGSSEVHAIDELDPGVAD